MGDSVLSSVVISILIVIILFIGPIFDIFQSIDNNIDTIAYNTVNTFQKQVRKDGYVDEQGYVEFLKNLSVTGKIYSIQLIHTSNLYYPGETEGTYQKEKIQYGTENILNVIKDGTSKYTMRYGDDFKVIIQEKEMGMSRALLSTVRGKMDYNSHLLIFTGGGMVENEAF